ncbi:bacteriocin resistance protein [Vibrio breoganii]|uniref:C39 family peptidase n=1 Tax=Vibrio breoganii TaxID=553239 RepID=UPI000C85AE05|nr:C39 family peptidase [Vibrio breoganii]PMG03524.1 bacteriocin resistance protein [Vibrio breoganii]PML54764.1 bacteriocin resistance protein [Vibrio breoganii]PMM02492.1 bacteriocin resistance protein [Vibrio breoganii]PMN66226.1 bacteriocin resistance protein [Vibrio breoganii]PMO74422.1 bacteriocin resistance protein [Vibrio breoganii]
MSASTFAIEFLPHRANYSVPVKSYKELVFGDVYRQQYDFSCGSAALASLLQFHYQKPAQEQEIFDAMYEQGDKDIISEQGFSLLDMKSYLKSVGLKADGFHISLEKLRKIGVPGITLVNFDGYMHFVVIRGISENNVVLGDPSRGTMVMPIDEFNQYYRGLTLLVRNEAKIGKAGFISDDNFSIYNTSPLESGVSRESLGVFSITLPSPGDY